MQKAEKRLKAWFRALQELLDTEVRRRNMADKIASERLHDLQQWATLHSYDVSTWRGAPSEFEV